MRGSRAARKLTINHLAAAHAEMKQDPLSMRRKKWAKDLASSRSKKYFSVKTRSKAAID